MGTAVLKADTIRTSINTQGAPCGHRELRERLAIYLSRAYDCEVETYWVQDAATVEGLLVFEGRQDTWQGDS